ncbi:PAS domain-containing sensor histidine kinase [Hydrogenimonas thermophila]|uniref:histidine kinase n=1 Tax=Hydrogenimonas thermophila TaxID=223786 RepID=A0A1I5NGB9_9BACT|nr:PAS domain-containing sensor histidine kinase [Hydrogenimonas thermophila]WOE69863.1 PAS domain-containing sensor histidine kinase [Hydrogenimonas thermophila]WOE72378.1 PAS domain-containing sensor histidine kinase [Hydrogenimonas thermophila]SFP20396.1 PAS domain S-box-containing protein [Hydrogenimonas thermophila]
MFKQYKEAIESSNIVSKTDINGIITFVNDEFCKISGYSREELIGQNHNIVRHPDVPKTKFKKLWDTILAKKTYKSTVKNRAKNGSTFYVNTTIVPILNKDGEIEEFIAIRYDVTHEVELKKALEKKERELEILNKTLEERVKMQTQKLYNLNKHLEERIQEEVKKNEEKQKMLFLQSRMASLGQMMANIAHQWRQPLTELALTLFTMKRAAHKSDLKEFDAIYNDAKAMIQNMSQTIENFINFFKPDKPKIPFPVIQSIDEALQILKKSFQKDYIDINKYINGNPYVLGISNELSQVIINILQNAKDAFLQHDCKEKKIKIKVEEDSNNVYIIIEDSAGGIDNSVIERIFEPYFTTKHASKGTGLGLFMSKLIIEKSFEGTIEVSNTEEGACFTIILPLYTGSTKET